MAIKTWNASSASTWNTAGNWDPSGVPGAADDVVFNVTSVNNCTCDVAIDIASIDVQSAYSGILDFADSAYAHAIAGDATFDGGGTVDCGDATITVGGNWDHADQATFTGGSSLLDMTGDGATITPNASYAARLHDLSISNNTAIGTNIGFMDGDLVVDNTKTLTLNEAFYHYTGSLNNQGTIDIGVSGNFRCRANSYVSFGTTTGLGSITFDHAISTSLVPATVFGVEVKITASTWDSDFYLGGDLVFNENFVIFANTGKVATISSDTYDMEFKKDVESTETGTITWTAGTGTIDIAGTTAQSIDFNGESVEDITISNTAATVTFTGDVTTDSLTQNAGSDVAGAVTITVTPGNFVINGASGNECTWNGPDLVIAGTAVAHYTTATDSDASAGATNVTATDNCTDGGGNTDWIFGAAAAWPKFNPFLGPLNGPFGGPI